jgi:hypothetical protein
MIQPAYHWAAGSDGDGSGSSDKKKQMEAELEHDGHGGRPWLEKDLTAASESGRERER